MCFSPAFGLLLHRFSQNHKSRYISYLLWACFYIDFSKITNLDALFTCFGLAFTSIFSKSRIPMYFSAALGLLLHRFSQNHKSRCISYLLWACFCIDFSKITNLDAFLTCFGSSSTSIFPKSQISMYFSPALGLLLHRFFQNHESRCIYIYSSS